MKEEEFSHVHVLVPVLLTCRPLKTAVSLGPEADFELDRSTAALVKRSDNERRSLMTFPVRHSSQSQVKSAGE